MYPTAKKEFVLDGIRYGFRVGFDADLVQLHTKSSNLRSCLDHPEAVDAYLAQEVRLVALLAPSSFLAEFSSNTPHSGVQRMPTSDVTIGARGAG